MSLVFTMKPLIEELPEEAVGSDCKESLRPCQRSATMIFASLHCVHNHTVTNITLVRRRNALALFQAHAAGVLAKGGSPKGMEQAFAGKLQISPSMWSQIKSARPIGDNLARQMETLCARPAGWLDEERASQDLSPSEKAFLELALTAWRSTNSAGRKRLRSQIKDVVKG